MRPIPQPPLNGHAPGTHCKPRPMDGTHRWPGTLHEGQTLTGDMLYWQTKNTPTMYEMIGPQPSFDKTFLGWRAGGGGGGGGGRPEQTLQ